MLILNPYSNYCLALFFSGVILLKIRVLRKLNCVLLRLNAYYTESQTSAEV